MWGIKVIDDKLIAVGQESIGGDVDAAVWISDGVVWRRVPHDEEVFGGSGRQVMNRVVAGGLGVVGIGYDTSGGDQDAAVWTSRDGEAWTRVRPDEATFGGIGDQVMSSIAARGPEFLVAVGHDSSEGDDDAAAWTSDGRVWARIPHNEGIFGGSGRQQMLTVVANERGFVAVGTSTEGGDEDAAVWFSNDGHNW
jgi:hypothetical protein